MSLKARFYARAHHSPQPMAWFKSTEGKTEKTIHPVLSVSCNENGFSGFC
jgi:hypothetical protein